MQLWEIILIIVAIAFVILTIYLLITVKKLSSTLDKLDKIVTENSSSITSIVRNVDSITTDTKDIVSKVGNAVNKADKIAGFIKADQLPDQAVNFKKAIDIAGIVFTGIRFIKGIVDKRRMKKLLKTAAKR